MPPKILESKTMSIVKVDEKYHTLTEWNMPQSGLFDIIINAWWLVDDEGNPLIYTKSNSCQCNKNKSIAERFAKGRKIQQIPIVYVPININDYIE